MGAEMLRSSVMVWRAFQTWVATDAKLHWANSVCTRGGMRRLWLPSLSNCSESLWVWSSWRQWSGGTLDAKGQRSSTHDPKVSI